MLWLVALLVTEVAETLKAKYANNNGITQSRL